MPTYQLSNSVPNQTDAGSSGMAYTKGTLVTTFQSEDGWGYCYHGVGWGGNAFESEDETGYESERQAITEATENWLQWGEGRLSQDEITAWDKGEESERLRLLRERIGFSHYHISAAWPGSVHIYW